MKAGEDRSITFRVVHGDAASMDEIPTGAAQLVLTSPPYFDEDQAGWFHREADQQRDFDAVWEQLLEHAESLQAAYLELARVLSPKGALVVQVKDLRYDRALIPLAARHVELAERAGLRLIGRVYWQKMFSKVARSPHFKRSPRVGAFKVDDCEELQMFAHRGGPAAREGRVVMDRAEIDEEASPLWRMPALGAHATHPYQSPAGPVRRMIQLFSQPGELVVDPFAGHGTPVRLAVEADRWAIGYEIVRERVEFARRAVARVASGATRRRER
jgi:site-specific DNA-methyltransferase (adenine-specific)